MTTNPDLADVEITSEQLEEIRSSYLAWRKEFCESRGWIGAESKLQLNIKQPVYPYREKPPPNGKPKTKNSSQLTKEQSENTITFEQAANMCQEKLGIDVSSEFLENLITKRGFFPHLAEYSFIPSSFRNKIVGININRWKGFLNGRTWAKTAQLLFSCEE